MTEGLEGQKLNSSVSLKKGWVSQLRWKVPAEVFFVSLFFVFLGFFALVSLSPLLAPPKSITCRSCVLLSFRKCADAGSFRADVFTIIPDESLTKH